MYDVILMKKIVISQKHENNKQKLPLNSKA